MEQLLTVEQAATRLHVHPKTVRRHLQTGTLRGVKRGRLWRVPESALTEPAQPAVTPLAHALELIRAWDAELGEVEPNSNSVDDLRAVREAQTS
jgi:excisionase family DNA binding protein